MSLSDKKNIQYSDSKGLVEDTYPERKVKEFIRALIKNDFINTNGQFILELRKLAGKELTNG